MYMDLPLTQVRAAKQALSRTPALLVEKGCHTSLRVLVVAGELSGIMKSSGSTGTIGSCILRIGMGALPYPHVGVFNTYTHFVSPCSTGTAQPEP